MSFSPIARALILDRDHGTCFRCGRTVVWWPTGDARRPETVCPYSIHHRRPRGMGGSTDPITDHPANGLTLCGTGTTGCHGWVESHRRQALADGYLLEHPQDPRTAPVRLPAGDLVLLAADRYVYPERSPEVKAAKSTGGAA